MDLRMISSVYFNVGCDRQVCCVLIYFIVLFQNIRSLVVYNKKYVLGFVILEFGELEVRV